VRFTISIGWNNNSERVSPLPVILRPTSTLPFIVISDPIRKSTYDYNKARDPIFTDSIKPERENPIIESVGIDLRPLPKRFSKLYFTTTFINLFNSFVIDLYRRYILRLVARGGIYGRYNF